MYKKILAVALALSAISVADAQIRKSNDADPVVDEWNDVEIFEQNKLYPRSNVIPYGDENGIEKNKYEESPFYVSLNGEWRMSLSKDFGGRAKNIEQKDFSSQGWPTVTVPASSWTEGRKTVQAKKVMKPSDVSESGNYVATYSREFEVPKTWKKYKAYLNMRARGAYYVWVNKEYVGYSEDSRDRSEFEITKHLKTGETNTVVIQVVSVSDGSMMESGYARTLNGITDDIFIVLKPLANIMDYSISAKYDTRTTIGDLSVGIDVFNEVKKGQYYVEMTVWDPKGREVEKMGRWTVFDKKNELTMKFERQLGEVQPWTAETPNMYTLVLKLRDQKMNLVETVGCRFGFRTIEVKDGLFTVNGQPVVMRGVLYAPYKVDKEQMKRDLQMMKQHNVNAVRTILYSPATDYFYQLCDEMGLYVVCDANLQPLSTQAKAVATDKAYINLFISRMQNMYERLKNHPSIVAWSLGDGMDNGICMENAFRTIKGKDKSRAIIYSGAGFGDNTDVVAPKYIEYDDLKLFAAKKQARPLVMAAFGSAMGNSYGSMEPLWQLVNNNSSIQGGFAAYWNKAEYFDPTTGADMSTPSLVDKDGNAVPYLAELRNLYKPFSVRLVNISPDAAEFNVTNYLSFLTLNDYVLEYNIFSNLKSRIIEGEVSVALKPSESKNFKLKIPALTLYAGEELFIRFTIRQKGNSLAVPKGTELGVMEFRLPMKGERKEQLAEYDRVSLLMSREGNVVKVYNDNIELQYDLDKAEVTSYRFREQDMLVSSPQLNFWRAETDNDRVDKNAGRLWQSLLPQNVKRVVVATNCLQVDDNTVCIDAMLRYTDQGGTILMDVKQSIAILHTGDVLIDNEVVATEQIKTLPKLGMQMCLPHNTDSVRWFGLDKESYSDRRNSGVAGTHKRALDEMFYLYDKPQESGNHAGVRWLSVERNGIGLYFDMLDTSFNFSVYPYSDVDLYGSSDKSMMQKRGFWTLNADYRQAPVGSALAGQEVQDKDVIADKKFHFCLHIRAYDLSEYNPYDFCRVEYPKIASSVLPMPVVKSDRERFDQPMTISISTETPKAEIRYTVDGSTPDRSSALYKKPFVIGNSTYVKAKTFKDGYTPSFTTVKRYNFDYIVKSDFTNKPNTPYNFEQETILFDGERGDISELSRGWLGFSGSDLNVLLELSKAIELQQVVVNFAHVPDAWAFAPVAVQVLLSEDGENFSPAINAKLKYAPEEQSMNSPQLVKVVIEVNQPNVKYVRLIAKNMGRIPSWHKAKGLRPWIMVDEIELNEVIRN